MISDQLWKLFVDHINNHFANANQQLIVHRIFHQVISLDQSQELFSDKLTDAIHLLWASRNGVSLLVIDQI